MEAQYTYLIDTILNTEAKQTIYNANNNLHNANNATTTWEQNIFTQSNPIYTYAVFS